MNLCAEIQATDMLHIPRLTDEVFTYSPRFLQTKDICTTDYEVALKLLELGCTRLHADLSNTTIADASKLGGAYELDLSATRVVDVSMLGKVHTLRLRNTRVADVSKLGGVHTLDLSETNVADATMLGKVHALHLRATRVTDVSMLGGVYNLDVYSCGDIDASMLKDVCCLSVDGHVAEKIRGSYTGLRLSTDISFL